MECSQRRETLKAIADRSCSAVKSGTDDDAGGDPGSDPYTPLSDALVWPSAQSSASRCRLLSSLDQ